MEKIYIKARAKVNLTLSILEKRQDNYHNLESVFQKINLYDEMWIEKTHTNYIEIEGNIKDVKLEDNIIYKAYQKLKEKFPNITGARVLLHKKIPMQAGLAGGSTDCASFLIAMKKLFNIVISQKEIEEIACSLGADVIPCLYNGAVKARGIGEIITPLNSNFKFYLVIIKPTLFCSTKEMFKKLDSRKTINVLKTDKMISALEKKDINELSKSLYNDFEEILKDNEEIINAKKVLIENGAENALLSGAGSCVFGIFETKEKAKKAYRNLKENYETYICSTYNKKEK